MNVVKIILFCVGGLLLAVAFCGALILANVDNPYKGTKRFYRWSFFIGIAMLIVAIILSFLQDSNVITIC